MKKILVVGFVLFSCFFTYSQEAKYQGYMGRKFAIKYSIGTNMEPSNKVHFSLSQGPEIEYVLHKNWSILGSIEFQYSSNKLSSNGLEDYDNYDPNVVYRTTRNSQLMLIKIRKYSKKRGSFAPYGNYISLNLGFLLSKVSYLASDYFSNDFQEIKEPDYRPIIGLQIGRQFVFSQRVVLDTGISTSLPLGTNFIDNGHTSSIGDGGNIESQMRLSQVLRFYLAIGFMAF